MDIVTWREIEGQRGQRLQGSALRRDQDGRAMAKSRGMKWMREGDKDMGGNALDDYGGTCLVGDGGGRRLRKNAGNDVAQGVIEQEG